MVGGKHFLLLGKIAILLFIMRGNDVRSSKSFQGLLFNLDLLKDWDSGKIVEFGF